MAPTVAPTSLANGRAPSVSAYVAAALDEKSKLDDLDGLLQEMLAETGGPLTAQERKAADAALDVAGRARKKKRR